jgi:parvulin-like peptidyl-prolyl isomerase
VAKAHSHGFSAADGGVNDWTTQGSLRSTALDATIFALPVGALSQIVEDEDGFHIVRVIEREEHHHVPFNEVQAEIKQRLLDKDQAKGMTQYLAKLRERTPVSDLLKGDNSTIAARPANPQR